MKLIIAVVVVVVAMVVASSSGAQIDGGFNEERDVCPNHPTPADLDAISVFNATRPLIEERLGRSLEASVLRSYRSQVVAGMRFLLRIEAAPGAPEFIHASVWRQLTDEVVLGEVDANKTATDVLE